eukprot:747918-Hanusia_phi.AAC.1
MPLPARELRHSNSPDATDTLAHHLTQQDRKDMASVLLLPAQAPPVVKRVSNPLTARQLKISNIYGSSLLLPSVTLPPNPALHPQSAPSTSVPPLACLVEVSPDRPFSPLSSLCSEAHSSAFLSSRGHSRVFLNSEWARVLTPLLSVLSVSSPLLSPPFAPLHVPLSPPPSPLLSRLLGMASFNQWGVLVQFRASGLFRGTTGRRGDEGLIFTDDRTVCRTPRLGAGPCGTKGRATETSPGSGVTVPRHRTVSQRRHRL